MGIDHYENFPVASVLCPPRLRAAVIAIYHYARTADDIADEGDAPAAQRVRELQAYLDDLHRVLSGAPASPRWARVFDPLARVIERHALPGQLLEDLILAFLQDVANPRYAGRAEVLEYCRLSANPVGRLLLHLHGIAEPQALQRSDSICTALQLINFWQDCSIDLPRGRVYLPEEDARRHGVCLDEPGTLQDGPGTQALLRDLCAWARQKMLQGAELPLDLPGRSGWELRFVVQGGLRVLEKISRMDHRVLRQRPVIDWSDALPLAWSALRMRRSGTTWGAR